MKKTLAILILLLPSSFSIAGTATSANVIGIMSDQGHGDKVFIKLNKPIDNSPDCYTNSIWSFVLPIETELTKKTLFSMLLTAYSAQKPITVIGYGTCDTHNGIETLRRIELK